MKRRFLQVASLALTMAATSGVRAQNPQESSSGASSTPGVSGEAAPAPQAPAQSPTLAEDEHESDVESGQGLEDVGAATAAASDATPATPAAPATAGPSGETPADAEEEEEKLPFRGSIFFWDHSYGVYGFFRNSQLSYNPTYEWWFSFRPRWYFNDNTYISARQDLFYELTDSDSTPTNHQLTAGDLSLFFTRAGVVELEGVKLNLGGTLSLPMSTASRRAGNIFGIGPSASVSRTFEHVLEGFTVGASMAWTHTFASRNVTHVENSYPCHAPDPSLPAVCEQVGGPSNVSDSVLTGASLSLTPIKNMSIDFAAFWIFRHARSLEDATFTASGREYTIEDSSRTHWRNLTLFSLGVGYNVLDWLNLALGVYTYSGQLNPDGTTRNPFFNYDTRTTFTATIALDELYKVLRPTHESSEQNPNRTAARSPARVRQ